MTTTSASGDPTDLTITELGAAFRARRLSPVEATEACLERIARLDPELHAFITVTADLALDQARVAATSSSAATIAVRCTASRSR